MSRTRYGTGLTGAAYNLLTAIEHGDRANVHGWSVALRKELDAYLAGALLADTPSVEPAGLDVERLARAMHFHHQHVDALPDQQWDDLTESFKAMWRADATRVAAGYALLPTQASDKETT